MIVVEDYLTFCFRKELSMTPIAYLNRYRINQAKQLLGHFSRIFRREVGMSPMPTVRL